MKFQRAFGLILVLILGTAGTLAALRAQQAAPTAKDAQAQADERILIEIRDHNEIMANLAYLSDMIGQRLTGSENLKKANDWTRQRFADYGLASAHLEAWTVAHGWTRGAARGRILSPAEHPLTLASYGWAPGTGGPVSGPVAYVKGESPADLEAYRGKLKGAIVITNTPTPLPPQDTPTPNPMLVPYDDPFLLIRPLRPGEQPEQDRERRRRFVRARQDFLKSEGAIAMLTDSGKFDGLLMQRGPVRVEVDITNSISDKPIEVYNTVAEIRGSEKPDEIVVLGAHLDSWDLGTGTTDNGTGSMVVLEAARAIQKLGLRPKRTIRFALFSGEEQGLNGSRAYVAAHKDEVPRISGALIHDTGTGRVISISLMRNYQARQVMDKVVAPLHALGLLELSERWMTGSDHVPFEEAGVPGFYCIQEPAQYFQTHHSQADTFDQAHEADLVEGAQVMAAWAYNVAQLPELLPRKPARDPSLD